MRTLISVFFFHAGLANGISTVCQSDEIETSDFFNIDNSQLSCIVKERCQFFYMATASIESAAKVPIFYTSLCIHLFRRIQTIFNVSFHIYSPFPC